MLFCLLLIFFNFRNTCTRRVSNSLDPDQEQCSVQSDLGPNCLQRLSADDASQNIVNLQNIVKGCM